MKKEMLYVFAALFVLGLAQIASASVTVIGDGFTVEVDVDDDKVKPGESFSVEVDVTNNVNFDIEDIEVEVEVQDIDDGDDLDDDDDIDDLDAGDDDNIEFDFDTPLAVKDKDYDIVVTVTGDNAQNSSKYKVIVNATIEVEKDKHELILKKPTVELETLKCTRVTEMSVVLWNIGEKDEDVDLTVYNTELGINTRQSFDIDEGDDEDDIKSRRNFFLDLSDADAKSYTFFVKAEYDDGDERETDSFNIRVEECPSDKPTTIVADEKDEEPEVIVEPVVIQPVVEPVTTPVSVPAIVEEQSFFGKYGGALALGLAYIIVIVVGVLLVVKLLKKQQ